MNYFNTSSDECQELKNDLFVADLQRQINKLQIKKNYNNDVVAWLEEQRENEKADNIKNCATFVSFESVKNMARIVEANFCRERICQVCGWRRQAKFLAQMTPVIEKLSGEGYEFIFVSLTVENVPIENLSQTLDTMMKAYNKMQGRKKFKAGFCGCIRSTELTYNAETDTFHPHFHLLVAVRPDYFFDYTKYISHGELIELWRSCLGVRYLPSVRIQKVNGNKRAEVETLKYALKPSKYKQALSAFYYILKGRRLISFSGVFSKYRKQIEKAIDGQLNDTTPTPMAHSFCYQFDPTGGLYRFYRTYTNGEIDYVRQRETNHAIEIVANKVYDETTRDSENTEHTQKHVQQLGMW